MKKIAGLAVILALVIALIFIGKNVIAKAAIKSGVGAVTGLRMDIERMEVGILDTRVGINGMRLYNPPGYQEKTMIDMPEIYVDYDLMSFLKRNIHLNNVKLHLKELVAVRDKNGKLNIASLKLAEKGKRKEKPDTKKKTEIGIDRLELKIGRVVYSDYSGRQTPRTRQYDLNLHETFHNITDLKAMGKLILVRALTRTDIAGLTGFDLGSLKSEVSGILREAGDKGTPVKQIGKQARDAVEGMTEDIKKKFKRP